MNGQDMKYCLEVYADMVVNNVTYDCKLNIYDHRDQSGMGKNEWKKLIKPILDKAFPQAVFRRVVRGQVLMDDENTDVIDILIVFVFINRQIRPTLIKDMCKVPDNIVINDV